MSESENDIPKRNYKWPWVALGMALLGLVLAVVWMFFAVQKVKRERTFNPPAQAR